MTWDRRRPEWIRAEQDKALRRYLANEVFPYSPFYRQRFLDAGLDRRDLNAPGALKRLPPATLADIDDPGSIVLRPDESSIQKFAQFGLVARVAWAKFRGTQSLLNQRLIDPMYKPVHWHVDEGLPIGSTPADLDLLGELGRRWLERAGVKPYDVVAGLFPAGPHLPYWQFVLGCRTAGLSAIHLGPAATPAQVAAVDPTVIAGRPTDLLGLLEPANGDHDIAHAVAGVHTVLVAGERLDVLTRARLLSLLPPGANVIAAWAPPGVRALWSECRGGDTFHIAPDTEYIEIARGEIVWTAIGWRGSALLRLRTAAFGELDTTPCPACNRTTPRIRLHRVQPAFTATLSAHPGIAAWQVELRAVNGVDELLVFFTPSGTGHPGRVIRDVDRHLGATQYIVLPRDELDERLAEYEGHQLVDLRD